jgi:putative toxin-antitoxin system antitoxin component (TIGR02293 family)
MSVLHQQIGEWLGVPVPKTDQQMLDLVERQLPTSAINRLVVLGITRPEIDTLVIPLRTLQHRRSRSEKLTVEESDRVLRVARLLSQAKSVYDSHDRALAWLRRPHPRLRGRTPLEMLKTDTGSRMVEELLVQIDEGMFV